MLAACAARLQGQSNLVWVDLGGGTGVGHLISTSSIASVELSQDL